MENKVRSRGQEKGEKYEMIKLNFFVGVNLITEVMYILVFLSRGDDLEKAKERQQSSCNSP